MMNNAAKIEKIFNSCKYFCFFLELRIYNWLNDWLKKEPLAVASGSHKKIEKKNYYLSVEGFPSYRILSDAFG